jgi:hypothetical protein
MSASKSSIDKIRVINRSLRCFVLGGLGVIPFLGFGPAVIALVIDRKVQAEARLEWNPAKRYLVLGRVLAWVGLSLSILIIVGGILAFWFSL